MFEDAIKDPPLVAPLNHRVFIPIKALSERCHGKNWATLHGKPLWRIAVCRALSIFRQVVVDTDDLNILDGEAYRPWVRQLKDLDEPATWDERLIIIPRHPSLLRPDTNGNDLYKYWDDIAPPEDPTVNQLYCTAPFVHSSEIRWALYRLSECQGDLSAATPGNTMHDFTWTWDGYQMKRQYEGLPRSQDINGRLIESTAFYTTMRNQDHRTPDLKTAVLDVNSSISGLDINTEQDLYIAQAVASRMINDGDDSGNGDFSDFRRAWLAA